MPYWYLMSHVSYLDTMDTENYKCPENSEEYESILKSSDCVMLPHSALSQGIQTS